MKIKHKIDTEFISICQNILNKNLTLNEWNLTESCDQFQSKKYFGGFDGTENEFTFSYYNKGGKEFWFQLPLSDVDKVISKIITEVEIREAD